MKKIYLGLMLALLLVGTLVIAEVSLRTKEDKSFDISRDAKTGLDSLGRNINYTDDNQGDNVIRCFNGIKNYPVCVKTDISLIKIPERMECEVNINKNPEIDNCVNISVVYWNSFDEKIGNLSVNFLEQEGLNINKENDKPDKIPDKEGDIVIKEKKEK